MKVNCNGELIDKENLNELFEPGFLFGWGVFETLRAYKGKVPFLDLHIERLNKGLKSLEIDEAQLDFQSKISELLELNNLDDA